MEFTDMPAENCLGIMGDKSEQRFPKEDIQVPNKHMKSYLNVNQNDHNLQRTRILKRYIKSFRDNIESQNCHTLLVGLHNGKRIWPAISQMIHCILCCCYNLEITLDMYQRGTEAWLHNNLFSKDQSRIFQGGPKGKVPKFLSTSEQVDKMLYYRIAGQ